MAQAKAASPWSPCSPPSARETRTEWGVAGVRGEERGLDGGPADRGRSSVAVEAEPEDALGGVVARHGHGRGGCEERVALAVSP
jgi:hypothetical protein